ncbi:MAG: serine protein kinase RIO [Candidatus Altiarchaeota archaeon]
MSKTLDKKLHHFIEQDKISQGVFDRPTMMALYDLLKKGQLDRLVGIIKTGKESNVYLGLRKKKRVAVKIYLIEASDFRNMADYIRNDPRFSIGGHKRKIVYQWAQREYRNQTIASRLIKCPKPYAVVDNILVMDYVGDERGPAPPLKDTKLENPKKAFEDVVGSMRKLYKGGLVHGDLSEYNILYHKRPVFIDFSMGVTDKSQISGKLLERDVEHICKFFRKRGVEANAPEVLKSIME